MIISLIRTLILYFAIIAVFRCMGKRQMGEMQPSELILAIMISDIATIPMESTDKPLINGIIPILTLMFAEITLSFLSQKSEKLRKVLTGSASVVIAKGKIDINELKRLRITIDDLSESLRMNGYSNLNEVEYAIMETNGEISIIPKSDFRPICCNDLGIKIKDSSFFKNVIKDGKVEENNLKEISRDYKWLKKILQKEKTEIKNVFLLSTDGEEYFLQNKENQ